MTLTEIREYLRRVEKGESVKDLLENKTKNKINTKKWLILKKI